MSARRKERHGRKVTIGKNCGETEADREAWLLEGLYTLEESKEEGRQNSQHT
jgi:hypothetical protein